MQAMQDMRIYCASFDSYDFVKLVRYRRCQDTRSYARAPLTADRLRLSQSVGFEEASDRMQDAKEAG
jgi:hypothetical protein